MSASHMPQSASFPPERFVVEVFSELNQQTIQTRWQQMNVILRLSMLTGLQMQLDATLNLMCDMTAEITCFDKALIYFWDESLERVELRIARGFEEQNKDLAGEPNGNILNFWAVKYSRPLLVTRGPNVQADALLDRIGANAALTIPLFVS